MHVAFLKVHVALLTLCARAPKNKLFLCFLAITAILSGCYCYHHDKAPFSEALALLLKRGRTPNRVAGLVAYSGERISLTRDDEPPNFLKVHVALLTLCARAPKNSCFCVSASVARNNGGFLRILLLQPRHGVIRRRPGITSETGSHTESCCGARSS